MQADNPKRSGGPKRELCPQHSLYFRDQLRDARAVALADAEEFSPILHALERLGQYLRPNKRNLKGYKSAILGLAMGSPLAVEIPEERPEYHAALDTLYDLMRYARNEAMHQGAYARQLANHAVEVALIVEDGLMSGCRLVRDYMVQAPIRAQLWEPLSFIRQKMLLNAFSYLPVWMGEEDGWNLVSDRAVASYLREPIAGREPYQIRKERLATELKRAIDQDGIVPDGARVFPPDAPLAEVLKYIDSRPCLVVNGPGPDRLLGIVTAFDLL